MLCLEYVQPDAAICDMVSVFYRAVITPDAGVVNERAAIGQLRIVSGSDAIVRIGDTEFVIQPGIYVFGPTIKGLSYWCNDGATTIMGAGLLPAGWDVMMQRGASNFLNQIVTLNSPEYPGSGLQSVTAQGNYDHFHDARTAISATHGANALSQYFRALLPSVDETVVKFTYVVDGWLMTSPSPDVGDLIANTGLSARQLERVCKQYFGMPPKMLARKYRALRAALALSQPESESSETIVSAFYDQSHMIREVKYFAGETPGKIRMKREESDRLIDQRRAMAGRISRLVTET